MSNDNIQVVCRVRPLNSKECEYKECIAAKNRSIKIFAEHEDITFTYDNVFTPSQNGSQDDIFEEIGIPIIDNIFLGYNGTVLAYGQTASGKTFTMQGPSIFDRESMGLIPRIILAIFDEFKKEVYQDIDFTMKISYVEIYMEKIRDLLTERQLSPINIRENSANGIYLEGVHAPYITNIDELFAKLAFGANQRQVSCTAMNDQSSRSHSVFIFYLTQTNSITKSVKKSKLCVVDLAGSEMVGKTNVSGKQLEEAKQINKSLSALGLVINSLTDPKATHIPYRDSKLTRLLQESFGGNSKTTLIICISPSIYNQSETLSTLRFGQRAKKIKNKPILNEEKSSTELKLLIAQKDKIIEELGATIKKLEIIIKGNKYEIEILKLQLKQSNSKLNHDNSFTKADQASLNALLQQYNEVENGVLDLSPINVQNMEAISETSSILTPHITGSTQPDISTHNNINSLNNNRNIDSYINTLYTLLLNTEDAINGDVVTDDKLNYIVQEIEKYKQENLDYNKDLNILSDKIRLLEENINGLNQNISEYKIRLKNQNIDLISIKQEVLSKNSEISSKNDKIMKLSEELKETKKNEEQLQSKIEYYSDQIKDINTNHLDVLLLENETLREEVNSNKQQMKEFETMKQKLHDTEKETNTLKTKLLDLDKYQLDLNMLNKKYNDSLDLLNQKDIDLKFYDDKIQHLIDEKTNFESNYNIAINNNKYLMEQQFGFEKSQNKMENDLYTSYIFIYDMYIRMDTQLYSLKLENLELLEKSSRLSEDNTHYLKNNNNNKLKISKLDKQLTNTLKEINDLTESNEILKEQLHKLEADYYSKIKDFNEMKLTNQELELYKTDSNIQINTLKNLIAEYENKQLEDTLNVTSLKDEIQLTKDKLSFILYNLYSINRDTNLFNKEFSKLSGVNINLANNNIRTSLSSGINDHKSNIFSELLFDELITCWKMVIDSLMKEYKSNRDCINNLNSSLGTKDSNIQSIKNELEVYKINNSKLQKLVDDLRETISEKEKMLKDIELINSNKTLEYHDIINKLKNDSDNLEKEKNNHISELDEIIRIKTNDLLILTDKYTHEIKNKDNSSKDISNKFEAQKNQIQQLEADLKQSKFTYQNLNDTFLQFQMNNSEIIILLSNLYLNLKSTNLLIIHKDKQSQAIIKSNFDKINNLSKDNELLLLKEIDLEKTISKNQAAIYDFQLKESVYKQQILSYQHNIESLDLTIKNLTLDNTNLSEKNSELNTNISNLKKIMTDNEIKSRNLFSQITQIDHDLVSSNNLLMKKKQELTDIASQYSLQLSNLDNKLSNCSSMVEKWEKEKSIKNKENEELMGKILSLQTIIQTMENEKANQLKVFEKESEKNQNLSQSQRNLENKLSQLEKSLDEEKKYNIKQASELKAVILQITSENESKLEEYKLEIAKQKQIIENNNKSWSNKELLYLQDIKNKDLVIQQFEDNKVEIISRNDSLATNYTNLQNKINKYITDISQLEDIKNSLNKEINQIKYEDSLNIMLFYQIYHQHRNCLDSTIHKQKFDKEKFRELQESHKILSFKYDDLNSIYRDLNTAHSKCNDDLMQLKNTVKDLTSEISQLNIKYTQTNDDYQELTKNHSTIYNENSQLLNQISSLNKTNKEISTTIKELSDINDNNIVKINYYKKNIDNLITECQSLNDMINRSNHTLRYDPLDGTTTNSINILTTLVTLMKTNISKNKNEYDNEILQLNQKIKFLENDITQQNNKNMEYEQIIEKQNIANVQMENQLNNYTKTIESLQSNNSSTVVDLQNQLKIKSDEYNDYVEESQMLIRKLQSDNDQFSHQLATIKNTYANQTSEKVRTFTELENKITFLTEELNIHKINTTKLSEQSTYYENEYSSLKFKNESLNKQISELQTKFDTSKKVYDTNENKLYNTIQDLKVINNSIKLELDNNNQHLYLKQNEIDGLSKEISEYVRLKDEYNRLKDIIGLLSNKIDPLINLYNINISEAFPNKTEYKKYEQKLIILQFVINKIDTTYHDAQNKINELGKKNNIISQNFRDLSLKYDQLKLKYEQNLSDTKDKIYEMTRQSEIDSKLINNLTQDKSNLEIKLQQKSDLYEKSDLALRSNVHHLTQLNSQQELEIQRLKLRISELSDNVPTSNDDRQPNSNPNIIRGGNTNMKREVVDKNTSINGNRADINVYANRADFNSIHASRGDTLNINLNNPYKRNAFLVTPMVSKSVVNDDNE